MGLSRGARGTEEQVIIRDAPLPLVEAEDLPQGAPEPWVRRAATDEHHGWLDGAPFEDRRDKGPSQREAEAVGDLLGGSPLLLKVDHVALGEHRAAARDRRAPLRALCQGAELVEIHLEPARLLLEKRPRAGGTGAVEGKVLNSPRSVDENPLRELAAQVDDRARPLFWTCSHGGGSGDDLVDLNGQPRD